MFRRVEYERLEVACAAPFRVLLAGLTAGRLSVPYLHHVPPPSYSVRLSGTFLVDPDDCSHLISVTA